jgi:hypothetical protein
VAGGRSTSRAPDFIGVGAQRCGTTWWFKTLLGHPQIRGPVVPGKEMHFFDRFCAFEMHDADMEGYYDLFERDPGQVAGEWTPRYMSDVWTPRLLRRAAPDAKLLVLLRDPIERYRSGVLHRLMRAPEHRREMIAADAVERGRYATQLARLRSFFPAEQILVLQYEKCRLDPKGQYRRTLQFLGVADDHEPEGVERPRGTTTEAGKRPLWPALSEALLHTLEPEVARLATLVPGIELDLWPNFAHLAPTSSTGEAPARA